MNYLLHHDAGKRINPTSLAGAMKQVRALSLALLVIVCSLAGCLGDEEKETEEPIDPDPNQDDGGNQTSQNNTNETNTSTNQTNTSTMVCYNRLIHYVTNDSSQDSCEAYMYLENHTDSRGRSCRRSNYEIKR